MGRAQHDKWCHPAAAFISSSSSSGDTFCLLRSIRQNADITIQKAADIDIMVDYASVAQGIMDLSCPIPEVLLGRWFAVIYVGCLWLSPTASDIWWRWCYCLPASFCTVWGGRLRKRFCSMFSGGFPCLLGQHGSCSSAQLPVELLEISYKTFYTTCRPRL